jgi:hypothetical protein
MIIILVKEVWVVNIVVQEIAGKQGISREGKKTVGTDGNCIYSTRG